MKYIPFKERKKGEIYYNKQKRLTFQYKGKAGPCGTLLDGYKTLWSEDFVYRWGAGCESEFFLATEEQRAAFFAAERGRFKIIELDITENYNIY